MSLLQALRRAVREGARAYGDEMAYIRRNPGSGTVFDAADRAKRNAFDEMTFDSSRMGSLDEPGVTYVRLPNQATMRLAAENRLPSSPVSIDWEWDDVGLQSGLAAGRTRREVAGTMNAALSEVGRRAVRRFPREYQFGGLSEGHNRLYERMARRLGPLYRYDSESGIAPTSLAYASYAGQQGLRGGGLLALLNALSPAEAAAPELRANRP